MAFLCPQPDAPAAPDYAAAATAQGAANKETAITQGYLNNPNVRGPLGGQNVTFDPITNQPTITQNLTPTAQSTLDAQQRVQRQMANLGEQGLSSASDILNRPFQYNGPAPIFAFGNAGNIQGTPDLTGMGSATGDFAGNRANAYVTSGTALGNAQSGQALGSVANGTAQGSVDNPQANANFKGDQAIGRVYGDTARGNFQGGTATGGVNAPNLQQSYGYYGNVQGAPNLGIYGLASSIDANQYGLSQGNVGANQYGLAQGGLLGNQFGTAANTTAANQYGLAQGNVSGGQYGQAQGNVGANQYGLAGGINPSQIKN
jgi:hypothetical protein